MKHKGFTVLEFLIVMAIMSILIGLILVGLTAARAHSRDQAKISNLQTIAVGITQYHDICREYPSSLSATETCGGLQGSTLANLIPEIDSYQFNTGRDYNYAAIALDTDDLDTCSSFHLSVSLERNNTATNAARFNSQSMILCNFSDSVPVDAENSTTLYDIHK
jgi:prepilin-type N-terminal cleavage/methylation domain-containing protein